MHTVLLGFIPGRMGNDLKIFSHLIANSIEYGYRVVVPSFGRYAQYFDRPSHNFLYQYPGNHRREFNLPWEWYYRCTRGLIKIANFSNKYQSTCKVLDIWKNYDRNKQVYDLGSADFLSELQSHVILILVGWYFRDFHSVKRHQNEIREFFKLCPGYQERVVENVAKANRRDLLIGVHIRQTDYRKYRDGEYYYPLESYVEVMRKMVGLWPNREINFLICSDEEQNPEFFSGMDVYISKEEAIVDMYSLAECDYIIGPPSSFSGWASFYGSTPIFNLLAGNCPSSVQDFKIEYL